MKNVLEYLEETVLKNKDKTAFVAEDGEISFGTLLELSKRIASQLDAFRKPIVLLFDQNNKEVISMIASMYAGGFYTVLDPKMPIERMENIFKTLNPEILIYDNKYKDTADSLNISNKYLYDKDTNYFYDLDNDNKLHKIKSSTLFHLFQEGVLDINDDKDMIDNLINNYLLNKNEFNTNYPIPSISISDKSFNKYKRDNSWGYYSEALIALRCSLWMDKYNLSNEYNHILEKWIEGLTNNFNINPMSQELDPITGIAWTSHD